MSFIEGFSILNVSFVVSCPLSPSTDLVLSRVDGELEAQLEFALTEDAESLWLYKVSEIHSHFLVKIH